MERRDFIALAGSAAVAGWPWLACAQDGKRIPLVGVLIAGNPDAILRILRDSLRKLGHVEGRTIRLEVRHADGNSESLAPLARELVGLKVDLLIAVQTPAAQAAKQATGQIPIVILAGDPVGTGLIASLARPGGNITGISSSTAELGGKLLQLIRELLPGAKRIAVLANAADPFTKSFLGQLQAPAHAIKVELLIYMMRTAREYAAAFAAMGKGRVEVVIVQPSLARKAAAELAQQYGLPSVSPSGLFTEEGGLMSYSANIEEVYAGLAVYADKVLKGAKPADLPVQQPTRFDFRLNVKIARALGVKIPQGLLARADRVIE